MLWGNKDDKTSTGTIAIDAAGAVTGTTTAFTTEARVGDYIVADATGEHYLITSITDNTTATVVAGVAGATLTAVTAGAQYSLNEKPKSVTTAEVPTADHGDPELVFGVDTGEQAAARANGTRGAHAGWVRRTEGTGGRAGRVHVETLVAMSSISGDAADDTEIPDYVYIIGTQPADQSVTSPAAAAFTFTGATTPSGGTVTYQWQVSTDGGANFVNSTAAGGTTDITLDVVSSDADYVDANQFRCVISTVGAADVTTDAATLTVV